MKKYIITAFILLLFPFVFEKINAEEKDFCKTGQKYYYNCKSVATQCTYEKENGGVAYININNQGEAKAAEGDNSGQGIKNWVNIYDGVPTIDARYSKNKECPPILIEYWGFYVIDNESGLNIAKDKLNNPASIYVLKNTVYNTAAANNSNNNNNSSGGTIVTAPDVDSCAGFNNPTDCAVGRTANNGNFGCAWNKQYNFCSPNGLAYLSCGDPSGNTDAHDIPVMVPRLIAYFIVILKTATPIVLIIMGMIQIIKAIANTNEDEIKKAKSSLIKKLIAAALVFFSISIVQFVVDQVVDDDEKGSMAACMKCFINNDCNGSTYFVDGYGKCYYLSDKGNGVDCKTDIGGKVNNQFLK